MNSITYALSGISYAIARVDEEMFGHVRAIYLFGSAARNTATAESDIDVFFDAPMAARRQAKLRTRLQKEFDQFRLSQEGLRFRLAGISNEFSHIVGSIDEWEDLKRSIAIGGVQVYGPARLSVKGEPWKIYSWKTMKNRGAFLNAVYGYRVRGKQYAGIIQKAKGYKIGKSAIAISHKSSSEFETLLKKYEVSYTVFEVFR